MKIFVGADHGGFMLKEKIKNWLTQEKYEVEDCGAFELNPADDYPDFGFAVAEKVARDAESRGIAFCRSDAGVVIAANKVPGVRAVDGYDVTRTKHARNDNNANVLGISADWLNEKQTKENVKAFLETPFSNQERHIRRIQKIAAHEQK